MADVECRNVTVVGISNSWVWSAELSLLRGHGPCGWRDYHVPIRVAFWGDDDWSRWFGGQLATTTFLPSYSISRCTSLEIYPDY